MLPHPDILSSDVHLFDAAVEDLLVLSLSSEPMTDVGREPAASCEALLLCINDPRELEAVSSYGAFLLHAAAEA